MKHDSINEECEENYAAETSEHRRHHCDICVRRMLHRELKLASTIRCAKGYLSFGDKVGDETEDTWTFR